MARVITRKRAPSGEKDDFEDMAEKEKIISFRAGHVQIPSRHAHPPHNSPRKMESRSHPS